MWRWLFLVTTFFLVALSQDVDHREKHDFKSDVSKMLDIIIHSLYTNRNIFLREVISNGSDALDKIRFLYLTNAKDPKKKDGESPTMDIRISADKSARTLTIQDGGIGMTKDDLINALGSLGSSGTKKFLESMQEGADMNMIGQFGVGFYSVFLVADKVKVATKHDDSDVQWVWESTADGTYELYEDPRGNTLGRGTEIILELKKDADEYLDADKLQEIVKQYSEFIHFPILVQTTKTEKVPEVPEPEKDDEDETKEDDEEEKEPEMKEVTSTEWKLVNENKPIWTRKPADIKKEEYHNFYKAISKDYEEPLYFTHFNAEGEVEFKSILYIPPKSPANVFDAGHAAMTNIRLYVRRVFITDEFKDLLPRYLNFIRGVVDSDDLPLNVSRELLQESRILKIIKKKLIRKALAMLKEIADNDEDQAEKEPAKEEEGKDDEEKSEEKKEPLYPKFWGEFGKSIRLGLIEDSTNRARLTKLLRYKTSKSEDKLISLEDYVERMPEDQKSIFYITGESMEKIKESPLLEQAAAQNIEVIYMTDAIDEYVVGHVTEFSGKKLVSLAKEGLKLKDESEDEKKIAEKRKAAWDPFLKWLKTALGERIEKATLSKRVATSPCVLVSPQYGPTANMERIMKGQALDNSQSSQVAKRIMEINHRHPIVDELRRRVKENEEDPTAKETAILMYEVAALRSGFSLEDTSSFADRMHKFMKVTLNLDPETALVEEEEYTLDKEEEEEEEGEEDDKGEEEPKAEKVEEVKDEL